MSAIDANYGGKYVFRHNVATNSYAEAHDINGTTRSCRSWEVYKNHWEGVGQFVVGNIRGGTGIFASNTIGGTYSFGMALSFARAGGAVGQGGISDGGSFWDGNQTNGIDRASGTHTGSGNAATLTDSGQSWTVNQFITPTVTSNRWIYNVTDGSKGRITANTATTITATLAGGTDNDWDNGDVYLISGGYPSRDQIGRGADSPQWTTNTTTYSQASEIARFWENDGKTPFAHNSTDFFIVAGRDYTNSQGSWIPATYPHPMAAAGVDSGGGSATGSRGIPIRGIRLRP